MMLSRKYVGVTNAPAEREQDEPKRLHQRRLRSRCSRRQRRCKRPASAAYAQAPTATLCVENGKNSIDPTSSPTSVRTCAVTPTSRLSAQTRLRKIEPDEQRHDDAEHQRVREADAGPAAMELRRVVRLRARTRTGGNRRRKGFVNMSGSHEPRISGTIASLAQCQRRTYGSMSCATQLTGGGARAPVATRRSRPGTAGRRAS